MRGRNHFDRMAAGLLRAWSHAVENVENESPVQFCDELAAAFFSIALSAELEKAYRAGIRDERRRRKRNAARRWAQNTGSKEEEA